MAGAVSHAVSRLEHTLEMRYHPLEPDAHRGNGPAYALRSGAGRNRIHKSRLPVSRTPTGKTREPRVAAQPVEFRIWRLYRFTRRSRPMSISSVSVV